MNEDQVISSGDSGTVWCNGEPFNLTEGWTMLARRAVQLPDRLDAPYEQIVCARFDKSFPVAVWESSVSSIRLILEDSAGAQMTLPAVVGFADLDAEAEADHWYVEFFTEEVDLAPQR